MFAIRLALLSILVLFTYAMGSIPTNEANAIAKFFGPLFFIAAPLLYFLPAIEAALRQHRNLGALAALNFFLGWTLVGWVAALVWALTKQGATEAQVPAVAPEAPSSWSPPVQAAFSAQPPVAPPSVAEELIKLSELMDRGLLTREEFDAQKAAILSRR